MIPVRRRRLRGAAPATALRLLLLLLQLQALPPRTITQTIEKWRRKLVVVCRCCPFSANSAQQNELKYPDFHIFQECQTAADLLPYDLSAEHLETRQW